jgi:hypothetical protein
VIAKIGSISPTALRVFIFVGLSMALTTAYMFLVLEKGAKNPKSKAIQDFEQVVTTMKEALENPSPAYTDASSHQVQSLGKNLSSLPMPLTPTAPFTFAEQELNRRPLFLLGFRDQNHHDILIGIRPMQKRSFPKTISFLGTHLVWHKYQVNPEGTPLSFHGLSPQTKSDEPLRLILTNYSNDFYILALSQSLDHVTLAQVTETFLALKKLDR